MCGIAGVLCVRDDERERERAAHALPRMLAVQAHRGPDDEGAWEGAAGRVRVLLGHRRLAILDRSAAGHQPMASRCGRYVLTYNGELYNYLELRAALERDGVRFRSRSDTEVLLESFAAWGPAAFARFNGMWALAIVDLHEGRLYLSRDRFGEKPLYYYGGSRRLLFASEIKALCTAAGERFAVNREVVARYLGQSLLQAQEETFFEGVSKVRAGTCVCLDLHLGPGRWSLEGTPYWKLPAGGAPPAASRRELIERVREAFLDSVRLRMRSDVPVGVLLSGGLDSSAIAVAMQRACPGAPLNILSAVSADPRYDETPFIDLMAAHLGMPVEKVELTSEFERSFHWLERAVRFNDEPVGDFSVAAHLMLMERARELGVTVILSGQGGDELLCGYRKYLLFYLQSLVRTRRFVRCLRAASTLLRPPMPYLRDLPIAEAKRYLRGGLKPRANRIFGTRLAGVEWELDVGLNGFDLRARQCLDLERFSVPALTHYEDRMSMSASREIRLPFLDHRLAELLVPLAPEWKLRRGWTKWVFRAAMADLLPRAIVWRRDKRGFTNPLPQWLRGDWRPRIERLLADGLLTGELHLVNRDALVTLYREYCRGTNPWLGVKDVFNPLCLELWARENSAWLAR